MSIKEKEDHNKINPAARYAPADFFVPSLASLGRECGLVRKVFIVASS